MGSACCCLRDDWEDLANPNSIRYRNCICVRCFLQSILQVYGTLFRRGDERALTSSAQGTTSLSPMTSLENSVPDTYRPPPRPLPYDADPRYFRLQRDGLISRKEKGSSHHSLEESEPHRMGEADEESEPLTHKKKWSQEEGDDDEDEEEMKAYSSKLSRKLSSAKMASGFAHIYTSSEDDDACPTCLEEYTEENPKIVTNCAHHFHLGCIYEWMERSDNCPVCGKVMAFDETP